jgi:hypothetical protein
MTRTPEPTRLSTCYHESTVVQKSIIIQEAINLNKKTEKCGYNKQKTETEKRARKLVIVANFPFFRFLRKKTGYRFCCSQISDFPKKGRKKRFPFSAHFGRSINHNFLRFHKNPQKLTLLDALLDDG